MGPKSLHSHPPQVVGFCISLIRLHFCVFMIFLQHHQLPALIQCFDFIPHDHTRPSFEHFTLFIETLSWGVLYRKDSPGILWIFVLHFSLILFWVLLKLEVMKIGPSVWFCVLLRLKLNKGCHLMKFDKILENQQLHWSFWCVLFKCVRFLKGAQE